jgi:putative ABC transport system permease protein
MILAAAGLALGAGAAALAVRGMAKLLYGVTPYDAATYAAVAALLAVAAAAACLAPALRASRVDPLVALRYE